MRNLETTKNFNKALTKEIKQNGLNIGLVEVMYGLLHDQPLPVKYKDHPLTGDMKDYRECHVKPDLLLVYQLNNNTLLLVDLGSHSELFG